ncbi:putative F-box protein At5g62660 [Rutidosis leptorrhynchoides]|uniref:putative F-box protein At5g62660 n=1 Tax=Rutidosis leptorrhynchoides TaxID=125765 RepID=UPI003A99F7F8
MRYPLSIKQIRKNNKRVEFVGSSYGLFCFTGFYLGEDDCFDRYVIWNPSIRKSVTIDVPYQDCICEYGDARKNVVVGFGVCPKSLDHKMVRINMLGIPYEYKKLGYKHDRFVRVDVFTLSGGVWRRPLTKLTSKWFHIYIYGQTSVVVNGFIYWLSLYKNASAIISFDLTSEEFTKIRVPHKVSHYHYELFKLRESLGVVQWGGSKESYDVWLLDNVSKSFIKLYTFTLPNRWKVVGFRDNDQLIIEKGDEYSVDNGVRRYVAELVAYEPDSKQFNKLGFNAGCYSCTSYTESLLLLDQPDTL